MAEIKVNQVTQVIKGVCVQRMVIMLVSTCIIDVIIIV